MEYIAHIRSLDTDGPQIQTAVEHCQNTAIYAQKCLESSGLPHAGYLAGLLHDAGKYKREFQSYLLEGSGTRGSVNHTFAGCRMILEHFHGKSTENDPFQDVTAELLAYAAGAHHGLFDCVDEQRHSGFDHRLRKEKIHYQESCDNFLAQCAGWEEIENLFEAAHLELSSFYQKIVRLSSREQGADGAELEFYLGLIARLLLSAVIEGDRRDTATFMNGTDPPPEPEDWKLFWEKYLHHVEDQLAGFPRDTALQQLRGEISNRCRSFAEKPGGVYRLNVPTGGGKTLSSLRYALAHAAAWGKKRIIFVTPLLAILEQNAQVIRSFIGDDSIILEHHSNVIHTDEGSDDQLDLRELAVESWHSPVIITTMVQLLNTFFLGKTTSVRRFQSLCDAVVVIDEVQTVPNHMLTLFNLTVNFLSAFCNTTFLLCSATQPCFEQADHPLLHEPEDVIRFDKQQMETFRRTQIIDAGRKRLDEFPGFIRSILLGMDSLLVVCNKKSEAEFLYRTMADEVEHCFHLSASMCMAHRRTVLKQMEQALALHTGKVLCIATQVIEAGVDISFCCVIRLAAGLDSIVQAAGRCNRNGESSTPVPVYVVQCTDENLGKLQEIQRAKTVTVALLEKFHRDPESFGNDLVSDEAIRWYYLRLYREMARGYQDYPLNGTSKSLFSLLSGNTQYYTSDCDFYNTYTLVQAFRTAGSLFHVFDENTEDAVVPYGAGEALIAELSSIQSPAALREWSRWARSYTVSLYDYQKRQLEHVLYRVNDVLVLLPEAYDSKTGLVSDSKPTFLEV